MENSRWTAHSGETGRRPVTDDDVVNAVRNRLEEFHNNDTNNNNNNNNKFALVETAGGVASPSSSGNLQSNVFARCRLPAILVGDGRLGGVSVTLTSYESLLSERIRRRVYRFKQRRLR